MERHTGYEQINTRMNFPSLVNRGITYLVLVLYTLKSSKRMKICKVDYSQIITSLKGQ